METRLSNLKGTEKQAEKTEDTGMKATSPHIAPSHPGSRIPPVGWPNLSTPAAAQGVRQTSRMNLN